LLCLDDRSPIGSILGHLVFDERKHGPAHLLATHA
jgi:hypothetical protein